MAPLQSNLLIIILLKTSKKDESKKIFLKKYLFSSFLSLDATTFT